MDMSLLEHENGLEAHHWDDPEHDVINKAGHLGFDLPHIIPPSEGHAEESTPLKARCLLYGPSIQQDKRERPWKHNQHEASIYLQAGKDNDKFDTIPRSDGALPAYEIAHNSWFYMLDLVVAILVLLLAACERPALDKIQLPVWLHGSLEILGLLLLSLELITRMKWLGTRVYFHQPRTIIKTVMLSIMTVEAIVVLIRQHNHFRVTRALRPIFLLNTHYCRGVRRIARQTLQTLPSLFDMLGLLIFIMVIFSILGFYLFAAIPNYQYFNNLQNSFISLFILLTTANYPDVMSPAYNANKLFCLFFIAYLLIELFFIMNLVLAVVYDTFSGFEKKKLKELFFHKREGCQWAFRLLVTEKDKTTINLRSFMGLLHYYRPKLSRKDVYLMFKAINTSKTGKLCLEEFYNIYNFSDVTWKGDGKWNAEIEYFKGEEHGLWSPKCRHLCNQIFKSLNRLCTWRWFDYFIYLVIACNFVSIFVETVQLSVANEDLTTHSFEVSNTSIAFVCVYVVEVIIKVLGKGPKKYFVNGWDLFDFLVTTVSLAGIVAKAFSASFYYIIVLRPLRLLRRYRDVFGTLFMLVNRLSSLIVVIVLVYYFFAIIAMEIFLGIDLTNCCKNTSVESYYEKSNTTQGFYYLNNFDNIFISGVTLFELTVVNNWYITMEGYANVYSQWARIYFILFFIVMMVVMNIVVAFILDVFLFRITYRRKMKLTDIEDHEKVKVEISLSEEEEMMTANTHVMFTGNHIINQKDNTTNNTPYVYKGERVRRKEDVSLLMYSDEVKAWIEEEQLNRQEITTSSEEMRHTKRGTAQC